MESVFVSTTPQRIKQSEYKQIGEILLTGSRKTIAYRFRKLYTVSFAYQFVQQKMLYTTMYNLPRLGVSCSLCKAEKDE